MSGLSERMRCLREARGLTQGDVAAILHTTQQAISRYEKMPSLPSHLVILFADLYGVSTDYLLGRTDVPSINRADDTPFTEDLTMGEIRTILEDMDARRRSSLADYMEFLIGRKHTKD